MTGNEHRYQRARASGGNWHLHVARLTAAGTQRSLELVDSTNAGRLQLLVFESFTEQPQLKTRLDRGRYGNKGAFIVRLEMWSQDRINERLTVSLRAGPDFGFPVQALDLLGISERLSTKSKKLKYFLSTKPGF